MTAPAIVTWLWGDKYTAEHVTRLGDQIREKTTHPFRLVCVTDRPAIPGWQCVPLPARLPGTKRQSIRLWTFSEAAMKAIGDRTLTLDIDMIVCGDLAPFLSERADFAIWRSDSTGRHGYALNPSVMLQRWPNCQFIWKRWGKDPEWVLRNALRAGWTTQDQAVISYQMCTEPHVQWTEADGIYSARLLEDPVDRSIAEPPADARIVSFHGKKDPADPALQERAPWLLKYWG